MSAPATILLASPPLTSPGAAQKLAFMYRLRQLDALRGLAALAVVLYHYTSWYPVVVHPHPIGLLFTFLPGKVGVDLFFLISGFVILMTMERSRTLADFVVSRFARLYPAYAACSAITLAVIVFGHFNPFHITPATAAVSMTMLAQLFKLPPIDASYWTLTYEVLFYLAAGTVYLGLGWRRIEAPAIAWLAVAAVGRVAHLAANSHPIDVLLNFSYANLFVAGMMLHRVTEGRATRLSWVTLAFAGVVTVLPTGVFQIHSRPSHIAVVMIFAGVVGAAAKGWLRPLQWAPLLFLGDISYSLYLIHQTVGFYIIARLEAAGFGANLSVAVAVAVAITLATAVRRLVERPAQQAIRAAYDRTRRRRLPAATAPT